MEKKTMFKRIFAWIERIYSRMPEDNTPDIVRVLQEIANDSKL